jgi:rhodanese-related sulfurtransferase
MARMLYLALGLSVLALIVAVLARSSASGVHAKIEDAQNDARRRAENAVAELEQKLELMRRMLALMAGGQQLSPEMILEGRLWRDAPTKEGIELVQQGKVRILDVRTPQETAQGIIPGATLIPVDQLESRVKELAKDKPMLVYCAGGGRSAAACEFLSQQGFENLLNLEGGFSSWTGPTARPK